MIKITEIFPEIVVVMKSGRVLRGLSNRVQNNFRRSLLNEVWSNYLQILIDENILDAPPRPLSLFMKESLLKRYTPWRSTLFSIFLDWRDVYRAQPPLQA
jgi:hypothetical protein